MNGQLKPFERGMLTLPPKETFVEQLVATGIDAEKAAQAYEKLKRDKVWINDEYQVNIDENPKHGFPDTVIWHLSIKRRDKNSIHDWRDLQAIKNELCGTGYEAVELYPAESRLVDSANQYHLWVFVRMDGRIAPTIPIGFGNRLVTDEPILQAKQRPLPKTDNPACGEPGHICKCGD